MYSKTGYMGKVRHLQHVHLIVNIKSIMTYHDITLRLICKRWKARTIVVQQNGIFLLVGCRPRSTNGLTHHEVLSSQRCKLYFAHRKARKKKDSKGTCILTSHDKLMMKVEQSLQRRHYIISKFYSRLADNTQHIKTKNRKFFCPTSKWEQRLRMETFSSDSVYGPVTAKRKIYCHREHNVLVT